MSPKTPKDIRQLLHEENEQLAKLHDIVHKTIEEEGLIVQNLMNPPSETLSRGQRISDKVARFGGSWKFIIIFCIVLVAWITVNVVALGQNAFDPYPFILMNLILSCIAAFQAPVIMMSQNRQEEKDRQRAENDYMINRKAELQIRSLQQKIDLLFEDQFKSLIASQARQLEILEHLQKQMKSVNPSPGNASGAASSSKPGT